MTDWTDLPPKTDPVLGDRSTKWPKFKRIFINGVYNDPIPIAYP